MAIAFDTSVYAGADYTTIATQTAFNITGGTNARGIVVLVEQNGTNADQISSVTYTNSGNGISNLALTEIAAVGESGEAGFVYIFFADCKSNGLGSVQVTTSGSATKSAVAATMTVANNSTYKVSLGNVGQIGTATATSNPPVTITGLQNISHCFFGVIHSGLQTMTTTPGTPFSATALRAIDRGSQGYGMAQGVATVSGGQQTCVWTAATAEDYAFAAAAFYETPVQEAAAGAVTVTPTTAAEGADTALHSAGQTTQNSTPTASGVKAANVTAGATALSPDTSASAAVTKFVQAGAITVTPTTTAVSAAIDRSVTAGAVTVGATTSGTPARTRVVDAGGTTVTPTTTAEATVIDPTAYLATDITSPAKTYGTITGRLGFKGPILGEGGTVTVTTTTTAAAGNTTKPSTAGSTTVTTTVTAAAGAVTKPVDAGQTANTPTTTAVTGVIVRATTAGAVTVDVAQTANAGAVTKPSTAGTTTVDATETADAGTLDKPVTAGALTVSPNTTANAAVTKFIAAGAVTVDVTETANLSLITKPVTAGAITVSPATNAVVGNVTKPATAGSVTVTPTTTGTPAPAADEVIAGTVTLAPTTTATASVTKFATTSVTVTPQTSAAFMAWRTIFLKPDAILAMSNLSGSVSDIQDSPSSPDGNGLTPTGAPVSVRFSFENPNEQLRTNANDQTIRVLVTAV